MRTQFSAPVQIIGGGLGGLTAALRLAQAGQSVVVHERHGRLGGQAVTDEYETFHLNRGPHALFVGGAAHRILGGLGIHPAGSPPVLRNGRIFEGGTSFLAPLSAGSLASTKYLSLAEKITLGNSSPGFLGWMQSPLGR